MCLAVPGRVESIDEDGPLRTGVVSFDGLRREVCLAVVPDARVGDWVVVHAGIAIQVVDPHKALATLALLREEP